MSKMTTLRATKETVAILDAVLKKVAVETNGEVLSKVKALEYVLIEYMKGKENHEKRS